MEQGLCPRCGNGRFKQEISSFSEGLKDASGGSMLLACVECGFFTGSHIFRPRRVISNDGVEYSYGDDDDDVPDRPPVTPKRTPLPELQSTSETNSQISAADNLRRMLADRTKVVPLTNPPDRQVYPPDDNQNEKSRYEVIKEQDEEDALDEYYDVEYKVVPGTRGRNIVVGGALIVLVAITITLVWLLWPEYGEPETPDPIDPPFVYVPESTPTPTPTPTPEPTPEPVDYNTDVYDYYYDYIYYHEEPIIIEIPDPPAIALERMQNTNDSYAVMLMQERLNYLGVYGEALLAVDGLFGPLTQAAVFNFQRLIGVYEDGVVDADLWEALFRWGG